MKMITKFVLKIKISKKMCFCDVFVTTGAGGKCEL